MAIDEAVSEPLAPDPPRVELCAISATPRWSRLIGEHDLFTKLRLIEQFHFARFAARVIIDLTGFRFLDSTLSSARCCVPGMT